jgi:hypothetical protein
MARSKHNKTGNGTHRQRIAKYRLDLQMMRRLAKLPQATAPVSAEEPSEIREVAVTPAADGLGHSHEDASLQDTLAELEGMVAHDRHEQLMDTFTPDAK